MYILLAGLLVVSEGEWDAPPVPDECTAEVQELERKVISRKLTVASWRSFRDVARVHWNRGVEVLPGMIGCPDLTHATAELRSDAATRAALLRAGISARDYVEIGWALLIAYDPETFPVHGNPIVTANIAFVSKHRSEMESLFPDQ